MPDSETIPPHVLANYDLCRELEAEYFNSLRRERIRTHSSTARIHFSSNEKRAHFFDKLSIARGELNAVDDRIEDGMSEAREIIQEQKSAREKTYEEVMEDWGSRWGGQSLAKPHQEHGRTVLVGEDL